jgi:hypothetical protein
MWCGWHSAEAAQRGCAAPSTWNQIAVNFRTHKWLVCPDLMQQARERVHGLIQKQ